MHGRVYSDYEELGDEGMQEFKNTEIDERTLGGGTIFP